MPKIGIVTWHFLDNYGSILQTYAITKTLQNLGHTTEVVNYRKDALVGFPFNIIRDIKYLLPYKENSLNNRKKKFNRFRKKYLHETKMFSTNQELQNHKFNYDVLMCGSDQIWASNHFDPTYYLNFVDDKISKISYAPSVVFDEFTNEQKEKIKKYLSNFSSISLREEKGTEIIKDITGIKYPSVLDPTLLLDISEWNKIITNKYNYQDFILCYLIGDNDKYQESISALAHKLNKKIINISITEKHQFGDTVLKGIGPEEFIELISKASVVVTDSYHGVLLSIKYNRTFYAYKRFSENTKNNQNPRIETILKKINLSDKFITEKETFKEIKMVDYKDINKTLEQEINNSINYLKNALNNIGDKNG